jgi:hypothetical protein
MTLEYWKNRVTWLAVAGAILATGQWAQAQVEEEIETITIVDPSTETPQDRPWLGIQCTTADATLRAQLKLPAGQGLVVNNVAADSPAAEAGVEVNDILVEAAGQPLKETTDLVKALEQSGFEPLRIVLLRSGDSKTIEITPSRRTVRNAPPPAASVEVLDILRDPKEIGTLIEQLPDRLRLLRAGSVAAIAEFPKDLTLNFTKEGNAPAKIVVKKGEDQWETTEDKVAELPDSVRGYVEVFLGRTPTVALGGYINALYAEQPAAAERAIRARVRPLEGRVREQLEETRRRADEAQRRIRAEAGPAAESAQNRIEQAAERLERQLQERLEKLDRLIEERTRALEAKPEATPEAKPAAEPLPVPGET